MKAARKCNTNICEMLLVKGADVNATNTVCLSAYVRMYCMRVCTVRLYVCMFVSVRTYVLYVCTLPLICHLSPTVKIGLTALRVACVNVGVLSENVCMYVLYL